MRHEREKLPLDAKLLGDAIIELNISRRNVAIYPKGHPSVARSLKKAYDFLQKLFELRAEISFAIAKETIIIDDYYLDKKNPVYREFALHLSRLNIASVTFTTGISEEEIYTFHKLLADKAEDISKEEFAEKIVKANLIHIRINTVNYDAFSFQNGKTREDADKGALWEKYVYGLLEGTLRTEDVSDTVREVPPEMLAAYINKIAPGSLKEKSYDHVITSYMRRSSERAFSGSDLKRVMDFISSLRPELKKQFLSSATHNISQDMISAEEALRDTPIERITELLSLVNEQKLIIPDALKNLLDKFSTLEKKGFGDVALKNDVLVDDVLLSAGIINLLDKGNFEAYVTDTYQNEIEKLLDFDARDLMVEEMEEIERGCIDEVVDRDYSNTLIELLAHDLLTEEEYRSFVETLKEQGVQFLETGQYNEILKIFDRLEKNLDEGRYPGIAGEALNHFRSDDFMENVIASFRIIGRLMRDEAVKLSDFYGESLIPRLMDALSDEESQSVRGFLISLIVHFGETAIDEAIKRLGDTRWFIKRNMIHILSQIESEEVLPHVRVYCRHENIRVSIEATKCLLKFGDSYGVNVIREWLLSDNRDLTEPAISLSGSFRLREVVPDLAGILRKKAISRTDFIAKIPIVKALGEIGDPEALPALREMLSLRSILFKGSVDSLKEEIYRSLKNYPYESIRTIVEEGLVSKNEIIKRESMRIIRSIGKGKQVV